LISLAAALFLGMAAIAPKSNDSAAMMQTVGTFARNGDPNNASLGVTWTTWPRTLVFDASPTAKSIRVE